LEVEAVVLSVVPTDWAVGTLAVEAVVLSAVPTEWGVGPLVLSAVVLVPTLMAVASLVGLTQDPRVETPCVPLRASLQTSAIPTMEGVLRAGPIDF
jgi:hypothetical protein